MKKLMITLSIVGLTLVAVVALILFLPEFPGFFAADTGSQTAILSPNIPPAASPPAQLAEADEPDDYEEYIPQTIHDFLAQNPFPEGFVADNSALPWYLKLVNRYNAIDEDFDIAVVYVEGVNFEERAAQPFVAMLEYARELGLDLVAFSGYRGMEHQQRLFDNQMQRNRNEGLSEEDAFEASRRVVAYPGTSEHNLGLALDMAVRGQYTLWGAFAYTDEGIWVANNAHRFGFILRYPYHKQHITNIIYEPWHFRYVGEYHATFMFENDVVLEEYIFWLQNKQ